MSGLCAYLLHDGPAGLIRAVDLELTTFHHVNDVVLGLADRCPRQVVHIGVNCVKAHIYRLVWSHHCNTEKRSVVVAQDLITTVNSVYQTAAYG